MTNKNLSSYLLKLNGANGSLGGYILYLTGATASTIMLEAATIALNAALTWGISAIITGVVSAISSWIKASEEITEKAQTAADEIKTINDTLKSNIDTVEDAKTRYAELAQEVSDFGKVSQNQGFLNDEEYEEFVDLSNQLSNIFPTLTKGYDENGNAILNLSGDVDTIVGSLDKLIEKEKELAAQEMMEKFPDVFKGFSKDLKNAETEYNNAKSNFDNLNAAYSALQSYGSSTVTFGSKDGNLQNAMATVFDENMKQTTLSYADYVRMLDEYGLKYTKEYVKEANQHGGESIVGVKIVVTDEIDDEFSKKVQSARESYKAAKEQLDYQKTSINSYLSTWLSQNPIYKSIANEDLKTATQEMLLNLDWSSLPEDIAKDVEKGNWENVSNCLNENIVKELNKVQHNEGISTAFSEIFSNQDLMPTERVDYFNQIEDYFGKDSFIFSLLSKEKESAVKLQNEYNSTLSNFRKSYDEHTSAAIKDSKQNLLNEYKKINDFGLDDYASEIKNKTIQSKFGNVDMDKRTIITWSEELKKTYADALSSWDYNPEVGGIDTVYGGSSRFGENVLEAGVEVAFTPIMNVDGKTTFLDKDTVYNYIEDLIEKSTTDGKLSVDKLFELDTKGIIAAVDESLNYENNGNWAETVGRLMHFSGKYGAVQIAQDQLKDLETLFKDESGVISDFFKEESINTIEELEAFNNLTKGITNATEAIRVWRNNKYLDYTISYNPATAFDTITNALKEQADQGYLTDDTLKTLKNTYGDLSDILLYTANGIQLNSKELIRLTEQNGEAALVNTQLKEANAVKKREDAIDRFNSQLESYITKSKATTKEVDALRKAQESGTKETLKAVEATDSFTDSQKKVLSATVNEIDGLNNEINQYDALEQSIYASISAINLYKKAKETANASDNYNFVQSEIETNSNAFENGLTKTDEFQQWMKYIGGFNQSLEYSDKEIKKYMSRVKRYYTESSKGLFNWLDDANKKSKGMVTKLSDGSYDINITDINTLAKRMDQSVSSVTDILLRMSETSGFNIEFDNLTESLIDGLGKLPDNVYEARTQLEDYKKTIDQLKASGYDVEKLEKQYEATFASIHPELDIGLNISVLSEKELLEKAVEVVDSVQKKISDKLGKTEVSIDLDSRDVENIDKQLDVLTDYRDTLDLNLDSTDYEYATIIMKQLLDTKHQIENESIPVLNVDVSQLEGNTQLAISAIQEYIAAKQQVENAEAGTIDINVQDAKDHLDEVKENLNKLSAELYTVGVTANVDANPELFMKQISQISADIVEDKTDINVGANTTQVEKDINEIVKWIDLQKVDINVGANTIDLWQQIKDSIDGKTLNVNVKPKTTSTSTPNYYRAYSESAQLSGSAHAYGTWNVGNRAGKNTLVGEIAPEIWVHDGIWETVGDNGAEFISTSPDDIIFNHKQSEQILKYGKLNSRGRIIGGSFVKGSAFNGLSASGSVTSQKEYNNNRKSTSSKSNSSNSSKNSTSEFFDWIERRVEKFQNAFDKWINRAEKALTKGFIESYYRKASQQMSSLMNTQAQAYDYYLKKANSVSLSSSYKSKVRDGSISIEEVKNETTKNAIDKYKEYWDKAQEALNSFEEAAAEFYNIPLDSATKKIELFSDAIGVLESKIDNAIGFTNKNKLIDEKTKQQAQILSQANVGLKTAQANLTAAGKTLGSLSSGSKSAISKKQEVNLSSFTEGSNAWKAAVRYNAALKAVTEATTEYNTRLQETIAWEREAAKSKFDNIADSYEKKIETLDYGITHLENKIDEIEARGQRVNIAYYKEQLKINAEKQKQYAAEQAALEKQLNAIPKGTDEWYDAYFALRDINSEISDCVKNTYELNNAISEAHFALFENIHNEIDRLIEEQDFLRGLMSHEKMVDDEGKMTDAGYANLASITAAYYASQANEKNSKEMVERLDKMVESGTLSDNELIFNSMEELMEYRQKYYDQWRDDIKSTYNLEKDIYDAMKEQYDGQLEAMQKLIDKKKEALTAEQDLYNYQKSISEKTSNISSLQKQISALSGDTSEEGLARLQKLQLQLNDAQKDLQETTYDRYIQDQQDLLDNLYEEYEEMINNKLDDFMSVVQDGLTIAEENTSTANTYLSGLQESIGYTGESGSLIGTADTISAQVNSIIDHLIGIESAISDASDADTSGITNIPDSSTSGNSFSDLSSSTQTTVKNDEKGATASPGAGSSSSTGSSSSSSSSSSSKPKVSAISATLKSGSKGTNVKTLQKALNMILNSGLKVDGIFGSKTTAAVKKFQKQSKISQDGIVGKNTKAKFKAKGYAKGAKKINNDELAWTNEGSQELIYRTSDGAILTPLRPGDKVFTSEMASNLWELSQSKMSGFNRYPDFTKLPGIELPRQRASLLDQGNVNSTINIQCSFPNVSDSSSPEEWIKAIQGSQKLQRALQDVTINRAMPKNRAGRLTVNTIK